MLYISLFSHSNFDQTKAHYHAYCYKQSIRVKTKLETQEAVGINNNMCNNELTFIQMKTPDNVNI
jgi:hypothetical protein